MSKTEQEQYRDLASARVTTIAADEINPHAGPAVTPLLGQYDSITDFSTAFMPMISAHDASKQGIRIADPLENLTSSERTELQRELEAVIRARR